MGCFKSDKNSLNLVSFKYEKIKSTIIASANILLNKSAIGKIIINVSIIFFDIAKL